MCWYFYQGDDVVVFCVFLKLPHIDCVLDYVTILQDHHHHYHHRPLLLITLETLSVKLMEYLGTGGPPSSEGSIAERGKRLIWSLQGCWLIPGRGEEDGERPGESGPKINVKLMTIVMWRWCCNAGGKYGVDGFGGQSIELEASACQKRSLAEMMIMKQ